MKQPDATAFPNGASLGASWNAPLLFDVGLAIGTEARGVFNSLEDKSAETGGEGWPGTLRNGATLTAYAPNVRNTGIVYCHALWAAAPHRVIIVE